MCIKGQGHALNRLRVVMRTARRGDDKSVLAASANLLREIPALEAQGVSVGLQEHNAVLEFLIQHKRLALAKGVVHEMEKRMLSNGATQRLILDLYAKAKDTVALRRHLSMMEADSVRPSGASYQALLEVALPERCVKVLETMQKQSTPRSITHYNTALKNGALHNAGRVLRMMSSDGLVPDAKSYNALIYACRDDTQQAEKVLSLMVSRGMTPHASTYRSLCNAYKSAGSYEGALGAFVKMQNAGHAPDARDFGTLIKAVTLDNSLEDKVAKAELLFNRAEQLGCRSQLLYVKMIEVYKLHGDRKGGAELKRCMDAEGLRALPAFDYEYSQLNGDTGQDS